MSTLPVARATDEGRVRVALAGLIGYLHGHDVRLSYGRWLPVAHHRALGPFVRLKSAAGQVGAHDSPALALLRNLADRLGQVALQNGLLKPTPAAWAWLDQSTPSLPNASDPAVVARLARLLRSPPPVGPLQRESSSRACAALVECGPARLALRVGGIPPLRPYAMLCSLAIPNDVGFLLDSRAIRRSVILGYLDSDLILMLTVLLGTAHAGPAIEQVRAWWPCTHEIRVETTSTLVVRDAASLDSLLQDKQLRRHLGPVLHRHRVTIRPGEEAAVQRALERRGRAVPPDRLAQTAVQRAGPPDAAISEWLWYALSVWDSLRSARPELPPVPSGVREWVAGRLTREQCGRLLAQAGAAVDATPRSSALAKPVTAAMPRDTIRRLLIIAIRDERDVILEYQGALDSQPVRQRVEPLLIHGDAECEYLEAWSDAVGAERTYRLDRMIKVDVDALDADSVGG